MLSMLSLEKQEPESSSLEEAQAVTPWVVSESTPSGIGFEIEEMEDGITEVEDENKSNEEGEDKDDEEWVAVLDGDEDDDDYGSDSDESLGDWESLETMRICHPMYFAKDDEVCTLDRGNISTQC